MTYLIWLIESHIFNVVRIYHICSFIVLWSDLLFYIQLSFGSNVFIKLTFERFCVKWAGIALFALGAIGFVIVVVWSTSWLEVCGAANALALYVKFAQFRIVYVGAYATSSSWLHVVCTSSYSTCERCDTHVVWHTFPKWELCCGWFQGKLRAHRKV